MKKRTKSLLAVVLTIILCMSLLVGCNTKSADSGSGEGSVQSDGGTPATTYKVTFYDSDGTTVLSTEDVSDGKVATEYTPEKDNEIFMGWFGTPSLTHEYDFTQPITADINIFAGFLEEVEDTRTFAIVGSGKSPLLLESNWGNTINDHHYLTKSADGNTYSITLDIAAGDEFQFAIDSSWNVQRGAGYMPVNSADGKDCFSGSSGLSDNTKKSNIKCQLSGNYTFTLTTYPGADVYDTENANYTEDNKEAFNSNPYDTIEFEYNGEMVAEEGGGQTNYYIKGATITGWEDKYDEMYGFKEENGTHTLVIDLEEGDEFLFTSMITMDGNESVGNEYVRFSNIVDDASKEFLNGSESYNMIAKKSGTYTFTYQPDTTQLTVSFEDK